MSASKINHYFEQDEVDKESFPVTLCGKMTTADIHQEDSKNKRCKVCERKLEKLS